MTVLATSRSHLENPPWLQLSTLLRLTDRYRLVGVKELNASERESVRQLLTDADFYGLLIPTRPGDGTIKTVSRDAASILLMFRDAAPFSVLASDGRLNGTIEREISRLILDGVLEVVDGKPSTHPPDNVEFDRSDISCAAIAHGLGCMSREPRFISSHLYCYNRLPRSSRVSRIRGDTVSAGLRLNRIDTRWHLSNQGATSDHWLVWQRTKSRIAPRLGCYKLYLNAHYEDLPAVIEQLAGQLPSTSAFALKTPRTEVTMVRPDKIVLYFDNLAELTEFALCMHPGLNGVKLQDLPFTSSIPGVSRRLTWGSDPPPNGQLPAWVETSSWRARVCNIAAVAISMTNESESVAARWAYVARRLELEGIDPRTWAPGDAVPALCTSHEQSLAVDARVS